MKEVLKKTYDLVGLKPYRAAFMHLILIALPLPTRMVRSDLLNNPCFGILDAECTGTEYFMIQDMGIRFLLFYSLAWIVWLLMRKTKQNLVKLHKILLCTSALTLGFLVWLQGYFYRNGVAPLEQSLFGDFVKYHSIAIAVSGWTILVVDVPYINSMKWSTPANSLFSGAVVNLFVAIACFQAYIEGSITDYYASRQLVSPRVITCFVLAGFWSLIHGVLLVQVRSFLDVRQLRSLCIAKAIMMAGLPFLWLPEQNTDILKVNKHLTFFIRGYLVVSYVVGAWLAGIAEGASRILTSEKDE